MFVAAFVQTPMVLTASGHIKLMILEPATVGAVYDRALRLESTKYGAVTDRAYKQPQNIWVALCFLCSSLSVRAKVSSISADIERIWVNPGQ